MTMRAVSFFQPWTPRVPLNSDIVPIEKFPAPKKVRLLAAADEVRVKVGDAVKTGQRLAADLVSPVTGTVTEIKPFLGAEGECLASLSIDVAEKDELVEGLKSIKDPAGHGKDEIVAALADLGFPINWGDGIEVAVVSCLDTDPVHTINQQVFRENADKLKEAVALLAALTGLDRVTLVVTKQLQNLAGRACPDGVDIRVAPAVYPNGLPEVLLRKVAPRATKGLVVGTEKLFAMSDALKAGRPRQDKLVTLFVPAMKLCKNLQVRIGTPLADILHKYEIDFSENHKLILGGAMRGMTCYSADFSVTSATDSIYVQEGSAVVEYEDSPCLNCGKCSAVCPAGLPVNLICRHSEFGLFEECRSLCVDHCIECGLCAYVCMARRPLIHYIKLAKSELAKSPQVKLEGVMS
ncbi:MAG: hypothetical protein AB1696_23880 [Planctomycetota bacterium]